MKLRTYSELLEEIELVKIALLNTKSPHLKRDYSKHLQRLIKERNEYERNYYGNRKN